MLPQKQVPGDAGFASICDTDGVIVDSRGGDSDCRRCVWLPGLSNLQYPGAHWTTVISGFTIALAFGFSVLIGVIFGLYPARKAAKMDPIDALRYE